MAKLKQISYLVGLPRAGNTVLGSIINQNKKIAVTPNTIMFDLLYNAYSLQFNSDIYINFPDKKSLNNVLLGMRQNYYKDWDAEYIIERGPAGFADNLTITKFVDASPKYILLVRDTLEIFSSWVNIHFTGMSNVTKDMVDDLLYAFIAPNKIMNMYYNSIKNIFYTEPKDSWCLIHYNDLVDNPEFTLQKIYSLLGITYDFSHRFVNLDEFSRDGLVYNDEIYTDNLHAVHKTLEKDSREGEFTHLIDKTFVSAYPNFWDDTAL